MKNEIKYAKMLESTGMRREDAETQLSVINGVMMENTATKEDLKEVSHKFTKEIMLFKQEVKDEFTAVRQEINSIHNQTVFKLGSLMIILAGLVGNAEEIKQFFF